MPSVNFISLLVYRSLALLLGEAAEGGGRYFDFLFNIKLIL